MKNKKYLDNNELKEEILNCINKGFQNAIKNGYTPSVDPFISEDPKKRECYNTAVSLGYNPERSEWISKIKEYDD